MGFLKLDIILLKVHLTNPRLISMKMINQKLASVLFWGSDYGVDKVLSNFHCIMPFRRVIGPITKAHSKVIFCLRSICRRPSFTLLFHWFRELGSFDLTHAAFIEIWQSEDESLPLIDRFQLYISTFDPCKLKLEYFVTISLRFNPNLFTTVFNINMVSE